ncbi:SDR family oxidoreductase [Aureimonas altamirensis]|uniref:SDR family NAD(P)-dependent oxidoreductase n=1 Tax=Aureimonas altamirensis TaxID=370622 RepID=UPI001E42C7D2|nr:SDR family oxidoreductase [Aureimonas altamirensis]UHD45969.1 SDR family oxidoreductase [Aureimonas altamirensis]
MKIDFTDRRILVTGSTGGIGLAIAKGFAAAGASVVINGRSETGVSDAISRLGMPNVTGFAGDMARAEACRQVVEAHPDIDILVNNLGHYESKDFFDITDDDWDTIFQSNVMSGVRLSRAYGRAMAERNWGRIVFVSSESAINIPVDMIHYGFTKTAQLAISRGLAKRFRGTGVTVNAVLPGPTLSEGVADLLRASVETSGDSLEKVAADFIAEHRSSSILRRAASPEEIANMVIYVCSQQASATTGAALRVDGGIIESLG